MGQLTMKFYGLFDSAGAPQGFWNDDVFPLQESGEKHSSIPAEAIEISEAHFVEFMDHNGFRRWDRDLQAPAVYHAAAYAEVEDVRAEAQRRINQASADAMTNKAVLGEPIPAEVVAKCKAIRAASDQLCRVNGIPADFSADMYWP